MRTDSKVCPGLAETEEGEVYSLDARTPGPKGLRCQILTAMNPLRLVLPVTEAGDPDNLDLFDVTCPHGLVTYRPSREESPVR